MLQDMVGIPVEAERGPYGAYQLQRSYKLPPLMFTDAEALSLTLGLLAIRELRFPVESVLPSPVQLQNDFVVTLTPAVQQRQQVFMRYTSWQGEVTERAFDAYGILCILIMDIAKANNAAAPHARRSPGYFLHELQHGEAVLTLALVRNAVQEVGHVLVSRFCL